MRIEAEAYSGAVAVVSRNDVKFLNILKGDKRGKLTLEDGSEWNARSGRRWGESNSRYYGIFTPHLTSKEDGERTIAYREQRKAGEERQRVFREAANAITQSLSVYPANDAEEVRAKIAAARAELDKLEAAFA
jgi:hypothetical protein